MSVHFLNLVCPLLGAVAAGSLGIVALASGRPVWRLAALCFFLMMACLSAFGAVTVESPEWVLICVRMIPASALLSLVFALLYVAELEEVAVSVKLFGRELAYHFGGTGQGHVVVFGKRVGMPGYVTLLLMMWSVIVATLATTDWVVRSATVHPNASVTVEPGPLIPVAVGILLIALIKVDFFLARGWMRSTDRVKRRYTVLNFIGFTVCYMPAIGTNMTMIALGRPIHPMVFIGLPIAVTIFYIAIVRYQFWQIAELNRSLEAKVRARTRALEQAQLRLVQSEKMGSLGRLVAGVAHEVNNPVAAMVGMEQNLRSVVGRMQRALQDVPEGTAGREQLSKLVGVSSEASRVISQGTERVAQVVDRLKHFARLDEADIQDTDVAEGVREAVEMMRARLRSDVVVEVDLPPMPHLLCDARALNQVWLNLLSNAVDSLPGGAGRVRVTGRVDAEYVCVSVHDDGRGMTEAELSQALDPGFTTKGVGVGTGLGLAICYQIVEDHGGHIDFDSAPGRGTTVTVGLKRARRDASGQVGGNPAEGRAVEGKAAQ